MFKVKKKKNSKQMKAERVFLAEKNSWSKNTDVQERVLEVQVNGEM